MDMLNKEYSSNLVYGSLMVFDNTVYFPPYYGSRSHVPFTTPAVWGDTVPFVAIFSKILRLYAYVYIILW
jgi:hypothetical protein